MRHAIRRSVLVTQLLLGGAHLALADPFFSAGVQGVADANDGNQPCGLPGGFSESYQTYPLDAFVSQADGQATSFNPCSALSGSPHSVASASLATGQLRVYALSQLGAPPYLQESSADAFFSDDVTFFFGDQPVSALPNGWVGEIRLDVQGTRSTALVDASMSLEVSALNGSTIGDPEAEDLVGGESLVVPFDAPFHFFAMLDVTAGDAEFADFVATITVSLPVGYSFGSTSDVLLTPEPGAAASLAFAVATIAGVRGRKRALAR